MIEYIEIERFKSIKAMKLELAPINILIGSNGSGKSNFISFFKLVNAIYNRNLQRYVKEEGVDNLLYFGRKISDRLFGKLIFKEISSTDNNAFFFSLIPTKEGSLFIEEEGSGYKVKRDDNYWNYFHLENLEESKRAVSAAFRDKFLRKYLSNLQVFHFHDTSTTSYLRRNCQINDNEFLRSDGRNLPAYLYWLKKKEEKIYSRIETNIKSVAPFIDKFILEPSKLNEEEIELRWVDTGDLSSSFSAYQLSDGTLRFIALATLLMQPKPPSVVIIDEPELGLHPFAITKLAGLIESVSSKCQVIISTQSVNLVDNFKPEHVIAVDRDDEQSQSVFSRLDSDKLKIWLEEYTLGDLWQRNIFSSGQPFTK